MVCRLVCNKLVVQYVQVENVLPVTGDAGRRPMHVYYSFMVSSSILHLLLMTSHSTCRPACRTYDLVSTGAAAYHADDDAPSTDPPRNAHQHHLHCTLARTAAAGRRGQTATPSTSRCTLPPAPSRLLPPPKPPIHLRLRLPRIHRGLTTPAAPKTTRSGAAPPTPCPVPSLSMSTARPPPSNLPAERYV